MEVNDSPDWVLVVEDQVDLWIIMQRAFGRKLPQARLVHDINVMSALAQLQSCLDKGQPLPRFVLSNLYLPRREDGFHLISALKNPASGLSHLPILIMSSSADPQDRQLVEQLVDTYLQKPSTVKEWDAFLNAIQYYWQHNDSEQKAAD